ncbi:hypothetical protein AND_010220 [Anopheles darlingi]|uniref:Uncharacterized protein n=1 Tax=Anopheles darlingi TaxID=43151 RepID=W5J315_ANODA|nr:hypothetical protein AND_010220 [Anopheles darlingi]
MQMDGLSNGSTPLSWSYRITSPAQGSLNAPDTMVPTEATSGNASPIRPAGGHLEYWHRSLLLATATATAAVPRCYDYMHMAPCQTPA